MDIVTILIILATGIAAEEFIIKRARNRAEYEEEITGRLIAYTSGEFR